MSEHQIVAFRAIDRPVSDKNLEYMQRQSSRAEITPWSFDNEYHYGDFRGNASEMLRRGYDLHLHYANFGTRTLMIRLPNGFPDPAAVDAYFEGDQLQFDEDKNGPGGTLAVDPCHEPDELEELWDLSPFIERLAGLRNEILDGDLRPLYLMHLAASLDNNHDPEETTEAPVPAGLDQLTNAQKALAEYYGLDDGLIAAAASAAPLMPSRSDAGELQSKWLRRLPAARKEAWLLELLADPNAPIRAQILAEYRADSKAPSWPVVAKDRTIEQLQARGKEIALQLQEKAKAEAAAKRARKLKKMAAEADMHLQHTEERVKERSTAAYQEIAETLADLREALAGSERSGLAEQQAQKLRAAHPKLTNLISALRKKGLLAK